MCVCMCVCNLATTLLSFVSQLMELCLLFGSCASASNQPSLSFCPGTPADDVIYGLQVRRIVLKGSRNIADRLTRIKNIWEFQLRRIFVLNVTSLSELHYAVWY